jgi:hypothetical protein
MAGLGKDQGKNKQVVDRKRFFQSICGEIDETDMAAETRGHPPAKRKAQADPGAAP